MILIIEDDPATARILARVLDHAGYEVRSVDTGTAAKLAVAELDPELILLDLILPDSDGLVLLPRLRALSQAPVIVCSARAQQADRVLALKLGADDFVAKPFDIEELEARVAAVLRRTHRRRRAVRGVADTIRVGPLEVVPTHGTVTFDGQPLQLTPTEYRLLLVLASAPGKVLSRTTLADKVWGYQDPSTGHLIDVHVGRLRHKLRRVEADPLLITVRGSGYMLAPVQSSEASAPCSSSEGCSRATASRS